MEPVVEDVDTTASDLHPAVEQKSPAIEPAYEDVANTASNLLMPDITISSQNIAVWDLVVTEGVPFYLPLPNLAVKLMMMRNLFSVTMMKAILIMFQIAVIQVTWCCICSPTD